MSEGCIMCVECDETPLDFITWRCNEGSNRSVDLYVSLRRLSAEGLRTLGKGASVIALIEHDQTTLADLDVHSWLSAREDGALAQDLPVFQLDRDALARGLLHLPAVLRIEHVVSVQPARARAGLPYAVTLLGNTALLSLRVLHAAVPGERPHARRSCCARRWPGTPDGDRSSAGTRLRTSSDTPRSERSSLDHPLALGLGLHRQRLTEEAMANLSGQRRRQQWVGTHVSHQTVGTMPLALAEVIPGAFQFQDVHRRGDGVDLLHDVILPFDEALGIIEVEVHQGRALR